MKLESQSNALLSVLGLLVVLFVLPAVVPGGESVREQKDDKAAKQ